MVKLVSGNEHYSEDCPSICLGMTVTILPLSMRPFPETRLIRFAYRSVCGMQVSRAYVVVADTCRIAYCIQALSLICLLY
jgi:hypothetical protein